jgi:hypothetical protein
VAEDMYVMSADGTVLSLPVSKPWPNKPPKCSDCAPLFMKVCACPLLFIIFCWFKLFLSE